MKNKYIVFDIETTGLNPWYGDKITCICAKTESGKLFHKSGDHELEIIKSFHEFVIENLEDRILISKNGKGFDVPFILTRQLLNGLHVSPDEIFLVIDHFDLHEVTSKWVSLNDMAKLFSVEQKSGHGADAIIMAYEGKWNDLIMYCEQDVNVTEKVYIRYLENKQREEKTRLITIIGN